VLVACEFSGVVRDAFINRGHDAISCDLMPTIVTGPHYEGDVMDIIDEPWDLMIAHPPCTYLAQSGVRWLRKANGTIDLKRWEAMEKAAEFFLTLYNSDIPRICIENPIMHGFAKDAIKIKPTQCIQPYEYGNGERKATYLWLRNLPCLVPTDIVEGRFPSTHKMGSGANRSRARSITYAGIAAAMADQWGGGGG